MKTTEQNRAYHAKHREEINSRHRLNRQFNRKKNNANSRQYHATNREHLNQQRKIRYYANLERERIRRKTYSSQHLPELAARRRDWRAKNPHRARAINRKWNALHSDQKKAMDRRYNTEHPEIQSGIRAKRRAIKRGATIGNTKLISNWEARWRRKARVICYWCKNEFAPSNCHADHVVALAIGGSHSIGNLCISCASCNLSKNASTLSDWNTRLKQPALEL